MNSLGFIRGRKPSYYKSIIVRVLFFLVAVAGFYSCEYVVLLRKSAATPWLDCAPSFLAVFVTSGLYLAVKKGNALHHVVAITSGLIIYELLQHFISRRTFDYLDILATIVGGLVMWGLTFVILKLRYPENKKARPDGLGI